MSAPGLVRSEGLTRRFGDVVAVHPLDLEVGPGGVTGLLGPNGSGKSTLLRMLLGLVARHGGEAFVDGERLRGDGANVRRRATYAPGEIGVYGEMRGEEHLRWLVAGRGGGALQRALEIAERLGLPLGARVRGYSHGMKRQLLFAGALGPDVAVRILDEPTEGLDPSKRREVLDVLAEDASRGTTVLLSSHHLLEVDRVCERLVFVNEGRLVADESAEKLRRDARRLARVSFASAEDAEVIGRALRSLGDYAVRVTGENVSVVLEADDPRPLIAALANHEVAALGAPRTVDYGSPSLVELYRELYGVEGV